MPAIFASQTFYLLRLLFFFFIALVLTGPVSAQDSAGPGGRSRVDSSPATETTGIPGGEISKPSLTKDPVCKQPWLSANWDIDPAIPLSSQVLKHHPYYGFGAEPVVIHSGLHPFYGKEALFYILIAFLLAFALLRQAFPKYFSDLFRLFFRTTLKQRQIREQLMQTPLPSLLLNIFFVISGGLYIDIILHHFNLTPVDNFWLLFLYCSIGLSVIYNVKFIGLKISGWLFNVKAATDAYIFVVFVINKVLGIFLLPFLVLLSFMHGGAYTVALVLSWCGLGVLLVYRVILTYASVRNQVRFNPFHFFLYICAFEIAPLLLIYKGLLFFFR